MKTFAINGNWIEDVEHTGHSQALQFGSGLFESVRVQGNEPLMFDAHMERLRNSAAVLGLDAGLDIGLIRNWTMKLLDARPLESCALKILWMSDGIGSNALFYFRPLGYTPEQRTLGLKVGLGQIRRNPHSRITAHKTLNYLDNLLERQAARASGNDESILLNVNGHVAEGTASNIFIRKDGILITPPIEEGILPGVQRKAIVNCCRDNGIPVEEKRVSVEMLARAEGFYLSNALMGFMPVSNFMGNCYDRDESFVSLINRLTGISD